MIINDCPQGFFCSDEQIMGCPLGHFCQGGTHSSLPHPCPTGYYQDKTKSSFCKPCPPGSACPFVGMETPVECPPGMMCNKAKNTMGSGSCPPGFFCLDNVMGNDPFEIKTESFASKCHIGSGCRGSGIPTGVVFKDSNSSTPLPCKVGFVCSEGSETELGIGACPGGYYCPVPKS